MADLLDSEPLPIVKNSVGRNGLEVWRKLHYRYDPQTASRTKDSYSQIVYTTPVPLDKLSHASEASEEHHRQHVDVGKGVINESLLCEALIMLCPKDLNENIKLQIDQLVNDDGTPSLDKIRAKIDTYIKVKIPVGGYKSGPSPMDLDSIKKLEQKLFALQGKNKAGNRVEERAKAKARVSQVLTLVKRTVLSRASSPPSSRATKELSRQDVKARAAVKDPREKPAQVISRAIVDSVANGATVKLTAEPDREPKEVLTVWSIWKIEAGRRARTMTIVEPYWDTEMFVIYSEEQWDDHEHSEA